MNNQRDSFIFYRSFFNAIDKADKDSQLIIYRAISLYALDKKEPELDGVASILWELIRPQIDANWRRFENGCRGGAPSERLKGNQNAKKRTKNEPKTNQERTEIKPKTNQEQTKNEPNVLNVNENTYRDINISLGEFGNSPSEHSFERAWKLFEKKGNRKTSERKWMKLPASKKEKALAYIPEYVKSTPDRQFRKNFETFINQECWNDELPSTTNPNNNENETPTKYNFID